MSLSELDPIFDMDGFVGFVEGRKGIGKTDIMLLIAEYNYLRGFRKNIATNIQTQSYMIQRKITNIPDLEDWLKTSGRKMFILDEAGKHLGKMSFATKKNKVILEAIDLIRHFDCGFVTATISQRRIDSTYIDIDILDFKIRKIRKDYAKIFDCARNTSWYLDNIPRTSITFNSKDIAELELQRKHVSTELPLCCQVAQAYSQFGSYKQVETMFNLKPEQIKRRIMEHCQHSTLTLTNTSGGITVQQNLNKA